MNIKFIDHPSQLDVVITYLGQHDKFCVDLETTPQEEYRWYSAAGLDPNTSKVVMLQIGDPYIQFVIDTRKVDPTKLKPYLEDPTKLKYGVNLKFDAAHLLASWGIYLRGIRDCMIYEMLLNQGRNTPRGFYSLEQMSERYLNYIYSQPEQTSLFPEMTLYKNLRKQFADIGNKDFSIELITYGATDVILPMLIGSLQESHLASIDLVNLARLECAFTEVLATIEVKGMPWNRDLWLANEAAYIEKLEATQAELRNYINTEYPEFKDINLNSHVQVKALFNRIGIPINIVDKEKSTDEEIVYKQTVSEAHIAKYTEEYAILPLYFEYKHLSKLVNTYGSNWLQYVNPVTNRVHSSYFQILNTGRISSNNPNLQNVPNEEKRPGFRRCFTVSEGKSIIVCDYSGQESRVLAEFSQDSNMIHFFNYGDGDMHTFTASKMFNKPANEVKNSPLRQIGKILNFSIAYGASAHKVSDTFKVDMRTAQSFIDKFYKAYPKLQTYFKMKQAETLENGYVLIDSVTNRRSYCRDWDKYMFCKNLIDRWKRLGWGAEIPPKIFSTYYRLRGEYQRNAQNYPIQGASSSMTKLAAVLFRNWIMEENLQHHVHIINIVHDEIVLEVLDEVAERASVKLGQCMEEAGKVFIHSVPVIAKPVVSNYWIH